MEDYAWLTKNPRKFLQKDYLEEGISPEERITQMGNASEKILNIENYHNHFIDCMKKGWFCLSTPNWINFGNDRGSAISCFSSFIPDSIHGILTKMSEIGMMSKIGGGTSAYYGDVRPRGSVISRGGKTSGAVHFMQIVDTITNVINQGSQRRGAFAAYLPVDHGDIEEFLEILEEGNPIQHISMGVCITNKWMEEMIAGDKYKRKIWTRIIKKRFEKGYPYIFFTDNVNGAAPQVYKDKNLKIHASNLCGEALLHISPEQSFVCDLASMNLSKYREWKGTNAVKILFYFLDAVMTEFIDKMKDVPEMEAARNFAINQRAIGLGVSGWHSLLQSEMIPFESIEAKTLNNEVFKYLKQETDEATKELAEKYGEPELLKGYGRRNVTCMMIPPGTASAFISGQISPGIEPYLENYYVDDVAKGKFGFKNQKLKEILKNYGRNDKETWKSILLHGGSVQHLDFLSENEKAVFKTFAEISQKEIVIQAAQRQKYIDQGQSLNLRISPNASRKEVSELLIEGWRLGIKTFYYHRSANLAQQLAKSIMACSSCAG